MASTRLPDKPLADIAGVPMVVRVARQGRALGRAARGGGRRRPARVLEARAPGRAGRADARRPRERQRRPARPRPATLLGLDGERHPRSTCRATSRLIDPALIRQCAEPAGERDGDGGGRAPRRTPSTTSADLREYPNVVKVVLDAGSSARCTSAARRCRGGATPRDRPAAPRCCPLAGAQDIGALRHIGLYAYRAGYTCAPFPTLAMAPLEMLESLEQLRVLWHGDRIVVHITDQAPPGGRRHPRRPGPRARAAGRRGRTDWARPAARARAVYPYVDPSIGAVGPCKGAHDILPSRSGHACAGLRLRQRPTR